MVKGGAACASKQCIVDGGVHIHPRANGRKVSSVLAQRWWRRRRWRCGRQMWGNDVRDDLIHGGESGIGCLAMEVVRGICVGNGRDRCRENIDGCVRKRSVWSVRIVTVHPLFGHGRKQRCRRGTTLCVRELVGAVNVLSRWAPRACSRVVELKAMCTIVFIRKSAAGRGTKATSGHP